MRRGLGWGVMRLALAACDLVLVVLVMWAVSTLVVWEMSTEVCLYWGSKEEIAYILRDKNEILYMNN